MTVITGAEGKQAKNQGDTGFGGQEGSSSCEKLHTSWWIFSSRSCPQAVLTAEPGGHSGWDTMNFL